MQNFTITPHTLPPEFAQGVFRIEFASPMDRSRQWALVKPNPASRDWVIVIHGHGSRGDQLFTRPDIRDAWLPAFHERALNVLTPDLRGNAWMSPAAAMDMHALVVWLREQYSAERCLFAGGSMGGTSNLIYAALHPDDVSGVVALCPATDLEQYEAWCRANCRAGDILEQIADAIVAAYHGSPQPQTYQRHSALLNHQRLAMPVWVCHSSGDNIIPVCGARSLAAAMASRGSLRYEEIAGGNHETSLPRFLEGLDWVLARLDAPSAKGGS